MWGSCNLITSGLCCCSSCYCYNCRSIVDGVFDVVVDDTVALVLTVDVIAMIVMLLMLMLFVVVAHVSVLHPAVSRQTDPSTTH